MFDWISELINGIGTAISSALGSVWETVSGSIWGVFMNWLYTMVYNALTDFFSMMTELGANLFDLSWVQSAIRFFSLFGWGLFVAGLVVAIFDIAIEYQSMGRINIKRQILPFLYGLLAVNLFTVVPVQLFRFAVNLQNTFAKDLIGDAVGMNINFDVLSRQALTIVGVPGASAKNCAFCTLDADLPRLLRHQMFLFQHQARRYSPDADCGREPVSIQPSERLQRRLYRMVQADYCDLLYGIHADNAVAARSDHYADPCTSRTWRDACGKRSTSHCTAVRS